MKTKFACVQIHGLALATAWACVLAGCGKGPEPQPAAPTPTTPKEIAQAARAEAAPPQPAPATNNAALMQKLKGRWQRPDGGYILEIRQVDANGQLDAAYFNPNSIRVTSAIARMDSSTLKVSIELNDVNYPGCKYELSYIPAAELLAGTYFQAAMQQTFEVAFERARQ